MKGVGRIYQQTGIDTYAKVAFAKLYDRKTPITAADLLNDRMLPFFEQHDIRLCRVLTDPRPSGSHQRRRPASLPRPRFEGGARVLINSRWG
jgi:hypothetical protein